MKKIILLGVTALVIGVIALQPQSVFAYKGDPAVKGPNYTPERHAAMTQAFKNRDYTAWKSLMDGKGITRKITAKNFAKFALAHDLALQGKTAQANAIRTELGLGQHMKDGSGQGNGQGRMNR